MGQTGVERIPKRGVAPSPPCVRPAVARQKVNEVFCAGAVLVVANTVGGRNGLEKELAQLPEIVPSLSVPVRVRQVPWKQDHIHASVVDPVFHMPHGAERIQCLAQIREQAERDGLSQRGWRTERAPTLGTPRAVLISCERFKPREPDGVNETRCVHAIWVRVFVGPTTTDPRVDLGKKVVGVSNTRLLHEVIHLTVAHVVCDAPQIFRPPQLNCRVPWELRDKDDRHLVWMTADEMDLLWALGSTRPQGWPCSWRPRIRRRRRILALAAQGQACATCHARERRALCCAIATHATATIWHD
mmetsp:Transcript_105716/g.297323  ORF Transcript_105716/g.297323 Transcript_105716/m.297323 type:complete len:301 (-) Transcript_105716:163-1065(-)